MIQRERERERERGWRGVRNLGVPEIRLACVYLQSSWLEFQITESSNFKAQPDEIEIRYGRYWFRIDQTNSLVSYINNTHTYTHRYISRQTDRLIHSYKEFTFAGTQAGSQLEVCFIHCSDPKYVFTGCELIDFCFWTRIWEILRFTVCKPSYRPHHRSARGDLLPLIYASVILQIHPYTIGAKPVDRRKSKFLG